MTSPLNGQSEQGLGALTGSREPGLASRPGPSGFDPVRFEILTATHRITQLRDERPDLFKTTRRAIGMWERLGFWTVGLGVGTALDYALTGTTINPGPIFTGMLLATAFVYFDPPAIKTSHTLLRDSDRSGEADETHSGSTVGESAGPQDIAQ